MARLIFGGDDVTTRGSAGTAILAATGQTATVYTDAAATTAADLLSYPDGVAVSGARLTVDAYSRLPLFQGPADGSDTLYAVVNGGPVAAIYARTDDRIDANAAAIAAVSGGATVTASVLKAWTEAEAFQLTAITYDGTHTSTISTATALWPDGSAGVFTTDTINATFETIDAYHVTHTVSGKTVTQPLVTRRSSTGVITVAPALTVA